MVSAADTLCMQVNLYVSARNLVDRDVFSKSDPKCVLYEKTANGSWHKLGKTEEISNNLNPDWRTGFELKYFFEKRQELRFKVVDEDGDDDQSLGELVTTLG